MATPFVQEDVNRSLGALLAGTWLNSGLVAIELLQATKYFSRRPESKATNALVVLLLTLDTLSTISDYACVWLYTITHWGDHAYATKQFWPIPIYLVTTGLVGMLCQSFLIVRAYRLSKSVLVPSILVLPVCAALGGAVTAATKVVQYPELKDRHELNTAVTIWLVSSAACDVLIAGTLLFFLNRVRVSAAKFEQSRLTGALGRLCVITIETGAACSVFAITIFAVYLSNPEQNVSTGLCFALARIYSLTILLTLNQTPHLVQQHGSTGSGRKFGGVGVFSGVEVLHTATVRVDDARETEEGRAIDLRELRPAQGGMGTPRGFHAEPSTFAIGTAEALRRSDSDEKEYGRHGGSI